jgi:hypothetical protein
MPIRSQLALRPRFLTCSICNELVELETAKTDEIGKSVDEECYGRHCKRRLLTAVKCN